MARQRYTILWPHFNVRAEFAEDVTRALTSFPAAHHLVFQIQCPLGRLGGNLFWGWTQRKGMVGFPGGRRPFVAPMGGLIHALNFGRRAPDYYSPQIIRFQLISFFFSPCVRRYVGRIHTIEGNVGDCISSISGAGKSVPM